MLAVGDGVGAGSDGRIVGCTGRVTSGAGDGDAAGACVAGCVAGGWVGAVVAAVLVSVTPPAPVVGSVLGSVLGRLPVTGLGLAPGAVPGTEPLPGWPAPGELIPLPEAGCWPRAVPGAAAAALG